VLADAHAVDGPIGVRGRHRWGRQHGDGPVNMAITQLTGILSSIFGTGGTTGGMLSNLPIPCGLPIPKFLPFAKPC